MIEAETQTSYNTQYFHQDEEIPRRLIRASGTQRHLLEL
jgi:hypothetical protein